MLVLEFITFGSTVLLLAAPSINGASPPNAQFAAVRQKREISTMISDLAQQFFNKGGQQGVSDLNNANSDNKMGVLQRYLGSALVGHFMGGTGGGGGNGGGQNDLISRILSSFTGSGGSKNTNANTNTNNNNNNNFNSGSGSSNRRPSNSGGSNNNAEPLPGSNSKTGVSLIDSRPSDRERQAGSGLGGGSRSGVSVVDSSPNNRRPSSSSGGRNDDDFDTESLNGDAEDGQDDTRWSTSGGSLRGSSGRGTSFSGDRRSGSSTEIFRGASGRRNQPAGKANNEY